METNLPFEVNVTCQVVAFSGQVDIFENLARTQVLKGKF